jgi:hypothetical protein
MGSRDHRHPAIGTQRKCTPLAKQVEGECKMNYTSVGRFGWGHLMTIIVVSSLGCLFLTGQVLGATITITGVSITPSGPVVPVGPELVPFLEKYNGQANDLCLHWEASEAIGSKWRWTNGSQGPPDSGDYGETEGVNCGGNAGKCLQSFEIEAALYSNSNVHIVSPPVSVQATTAYSHQECAGQPSTCDGQATWDAGPIDVVTGRMVYSLTDMRIDGALPIKFTRRYSSRHS